MPAPDPTPHETGALKRRLWRIFRLLAVLSIVVAALAVILVARGQAEVRVHLLIATGLGTGLMVLVGSALMALVFLSASSGHDDSAGQAPSDSQSKDD